MKIFIAFIVSLLCRDNKYGILALPDNSFVFKMRCKVPRFAYFGAKNRRRKGNESAALRDVTIWKNFGEAHCLYPLQS